MPIDPNRSPLNSALRGVFPWLVAAAAMGGVAMWVRLELVEPLEWALACAPEPHQALCRLRSVTIALFQQQLIGWLATLTALSALVLRRRWLAGAALLIGTVAAVLYAVEPGLFGALLGLLGLLRPARPGQTAEAPMTAASREKPRA